VPGSTNRASKPHDQTGNDPLTHSAGRALYCFVQDRRVVIVHAFIKKTRATPGRDLAIARQRTKEIQRG
jgi:phage-related protein